MKLSHSAIDLYNKCGLAYKLRYRDKLTARVKSSALYFGSAMDEALNYVLLNKDTADVTEKGQEVFLANWTTTKNSQYQLIDLKLSDEISYYNGDLELDVLTKEDKLFLDGLCEHIYGEVFEIGKLISQMRDTRKQGGSLAPSELIYYNAVHWYSMKYKGLLMIESYVKEVLPLIDEVLGVQMEINLSNGEDDRVNGFVDCVVRLKECGSVCILDNKTSANKYPDDKARTSQQLALYQIALNTLAQDNPEKWKHTINKVGYAVMLKKLKPNGRGVKRKLTLAPIQIQIDKIADTIEDLVIGTVNDVNYKVQQEIFEPNFESCVMPYGKCEFYKLCHENSREDLIDIPEKVK